MNYGQRQVSDQQNGSAEFHPQCQFLMANESSLRRLTNKIKHVKYFGPRPWRFIDWPSTLDAQESVLVVGNNKKHLVSPWNCNIWVSVTLATVGTFCLFFRLNCGSTHSYIVLHFLPQKPLVLPMFGSFIGDHSWVAATDQITFVIHCFF